MTFLSKASLRKAFDSASASYDAYAVVQKETSEHLAYLCHQTANRPIYSLLDVGAGTGQTTAAFMQHWPLLQITLLDLSPALLARAQAKFPTAQVVCADAETYTFSKPYDLVVSNLCLQWLSDLEGFLNRALCSCHLFAFSTLLESSFKDYRNVFTSYGTLSPTPDYPTQAFMEHLLSERSVRTKNVQIYRKPFENALAAARYFQKIGAHATNHPTSARALFASSKPVVLDYHVFFAIVEGDDHRD